MKYGKKLTRSIQEQAETHEMQARHEKAERDLSFQHRSAMRELTRLQEGELANLQAAHKKEESVSPPNLDLIHRLVDIVRVVNAVTDKRYAPGDRSGFLQHAELTWAQALRWVRCEFVCIEGGRFMFARKKDGAKYLIPEELFTMSDRDVASYVRDLSRKYEAACAEKEVERLKVSLAEAERAAASLEKKKKRLVGLIAAARQ